MRTEYDFAKMKGRKNPFVRPAFEKAGYDTFGTGYHQVFQIVAQKSDIPYQM